MFKRKGVAIKDVSEETIEIDEEDEEYVKGQPSKFSLWLNKYFHHIDRGGSLHGEIIAGISMFLLAICMLFVNMQVISTLINGELAIDSSVSDANIAASMTYASIYMGSLIVAFVGSIVMGLVARLPFVQISTMALGTNLLSLVSVSTGLSYYNMLFLNFIAALLYTLIVAFPVIHRFIFNAIPKGVRKAIPVALGLIIAFTCMSLSGILTINSISINGMAESNINSITYYELTNFSSLSGIALQAEIGIIVAIIFVCLFKSLKFKRPYLYGFLVGTLTFILLNIIMVGINPASDTANPNALLNFGRVWVIAGSSKLVETPFADSYLTYFPKAFGEVFNNFGKIFTEGTNFQNYEGNIITLAISSVLSYLFIGLYDSEGTLQASEDKLNKSLKEGFKKFDLSSSRDAYLPTLTNAATNVIAPFFGVGGVTLSKSSLVGIKDNAKSGIASIVASIGFLISMFIMIFPALLATKTYIVGSMNEWNYYTYGNGGFIYLTSSLAFGIADVVMAIVGFSMFKNIKKVDFKDSKEYIPAIITILVSFIFTNLLLGVVLGTISYFLLRICDFRKDEEGLFASFKNFIPNIKTITISDYSICGFMLLVMIFLLI